jgi:hypothetical protein
MRHVDLTGEWQLVHARFVDLRQQGFGDPVSSIDLTQLVGIEFQTPANVELDVRIDGIGFVDENAAIEVPGAGGMGGGGGAPATDSQLIVTDGGCGCRVSAASKASSWPTALFSALTGLAWLWRRRRFG